MAEGQIWGKINDKQRKISKIIIINSQNVMYVEPKVLPRTCYWRDKRAATTGLGSSLGLMSGRHSIGSLQKRGTLGTASSSWKYCSLKLDNLGMHMSLIEQ
jgi:hypothetical protein